MKLRLAIGCAIALTLAACHRSPFAGFKAVSEDVHLCLRMLGDDERLPTDSDSVLVRVRMAMHGQDPGSLFSTERWYSGMDDVLPRETASIIRFHPGDSVSMIAKGVRIPWEAIGASASAAADTAWIDMEISLRELRSLEESRQLTQARRMARTAVEEDTLLARYFATAPEKWEHSMGVRYMLDPKNPKRPLVKSGEVVTIAYTAHFLEDGHLFDDTERTGQPLTFRLGDPGQVIKGLEIAIHLLPPGGKGRFIIPSVLAFGAGGSSSGIVPPFTPVLYSVDVLETATANADEAVVDTAAWPVKP